MFFSQREDTRDGAKEKDPKCTVPDSPHTQWLATWKIFPTFFIGDEKPKAGSEFFELPATVAVSETLVTALGMKKGNEEGAQTYGHEWGADRGIDEDGKRDLADQTGYDAPGGLQMGGSPVPAVLGGDGAGKAKERYEHYKKAYAGARGKGETARRDRCRGAFGMGRDSSEWAACAGETGSRAARSRRSFGTARRCRDSAHRGALPDGTAGLPGR